MPLPNFESLKRVDPCKITDEWIYIERDRGHVIERVNRDKHNAPYSVKIGDWETSIEYLSQNGILMQPVLDSVFVTFGYGEKKR